MLWFCHFANFPMIFKFNANFIAFSIHASFLQNLSLSPLLLQVNLDHNCMTIIMPGSKIYERPYSSMYYGDNGGTRTPPRRYEPSSSLTAAYYPTRDYSTYGSGDSYHYRPTSP